MTAIYSFASARDAFQNGFVLAEVKRYQTYRGCFINGFDNSGRGMRGYSYGLRVEVPEDFTSNYLGAQSDKVFGKAVLVTLGSYSSGMQRGNKENANKVLMFEPKDFRNAIEEACIWTDKWFAAHPGAMERMNAANAALRKQDRQLDRAIG